MAPTLDSREINKTQGLVNLASDSSKKSTSALAPGSVTSVSFNEVAVYFSEEEWNLLESWQKELYSNVMKDIHAALLSLGYTILHPNVLCRIRRDREPYISSQEEDEKGNGFPSTSSSALSPDIILRIKHDEDLCSNEENSADSSQRISGDSGGFPKFLNMKEEELCDRDTDDLSSEYVCIPECLAKTTDLSANKKQKYDMEQNDVQTDEGNSNLTTNEANHLVFNPKFSIWIKQVDEQPECVPPVALQASSTAGGNGDIVKSEKDLAAECDKLPSQQAFTENISNKENSLEKQPIPQKTHPMNKPDYTGKGEESLLSLVLKRANAGSLYMPNNKYSNSCKGLDYSRGVARTPEKDPCYGSKLPSFQMPNSNNLLSFHVRSAPSNQIAHQVDKPFRCHICEKCFKTLGILNVHMKTHTGVRPYQCNECGKSFRDNWNLKVHQKIHTGETPYKCSTCDKGFIQYATYMKHQRIHTGEKPYSCCYCDKSFTNSSNLVRHHRTHTGEKPYTCVECGKSFSYNTSLIQHKRIHRVEPAGNVTQDPSNK